MKDTRRYSNFAMLRDAPPKSPGALDADDAHSYDLLPLLPTARHPRAADGPEALARRVFGEVHLRTILTNPVLLSNFADFLARRETDGIRILVYYLDTQKAIKALAYASAIISGLEDGATVGVVANANLEGRSAIAFSALLEEMAAYVTSRMVDVVSHNVVRKITGELRPELAEAVDGLGECFCLSDPHRRDNPLIFLSSGVCCIPSWLAATDEKQSSTG